MSVSLDSARLAALMAGACAAARQAGQAILAIYGSDDAQLANKADDSPLTKADLAAHHSIVAALAQLSPDIPVVSEEDADSQRHRQPAGTFWLIDPLDGTKEFIARNGEFTVNIALVQDACPTMGVVYVPVQDVLYWGGQALGAWRQTPQGLQALSVRAGEALPQPCQVVASKSHLNAETSDFIARLGQTELVQAGSSLKFCRVAEGAAHIYPRLAPTCEWDTAAAQAVLEGAGGVVVDLAGQPLRCGRPDVLNPSFVAAGRLGWIPR